MGGQTAFFLAFCRPADPESSAANDREFMVVKERAGEVMGTMLNFPCNQKKGIHSSQHEFLMVGHRAWNMQLREMVSANLFLCLFARWTLAPVGDWRVRSSLEYKLISHFVVTKSQRIEFVCVQHRELSLVRLTWKKWLQRSRVCAFSISRCGFADDP